MSFQDDLLSTHNEKRKKHGAPPLKWSDALERKATKWAQHLAKIDSLKHEQNVEEGENIAMAGGESLCTNIVTNSTSGLFLETGAIVSLRNSCFSK